jgi:hypothetical protein
MLRSIGRQSQQHRRGPIGGLGTHTDVVIALGIDEPLSEVSLTEEVVLLRPLGGDAGEGCTQQRSG